MKLQQLPKVLGVFQKLIASKYSDQHGFFILNTLIEYLGPGADGLGEFMSTIWGLLFHRLQVGWERVWGCVFRSLFHFPLPERDGSVSGLVTLRVAVWQFALFCSKKSHEMIDGRQVDVVTQSFVLVGIFFSSDFLYIRLFVISIRLLYPFVYRTM